jgi:thiol:disulfide interchange protein/DsbC/DsbD-like thiol-disulfide interchange protein
MPRHTASLPWFPLLPAWRGRAAVAATAFALAASLQAGVVTTPHVEAELVAERTAAVPGQPLTVALRLKMAPGWHTYWQNPGDSGLPTTLAWTLPAGVAAGPLQWPAPRALPTGPLVNYGYEGEVLLSTQLTIPADAVPGRTLALAARADWLVCKEVCIPEGADLALDVPVALQSDPYPQWGGAIAATRAALPAPLREWKVAARGDGQRVLLSVTPPSGAPDPGALHFFPAAEGHIEASGPQVVTRSEKGALELALPVANQLAGGFTRVDGVLTAANGFADAGARVAAATIDVPMTGTVVPGPKPQSDPVAKLDLRAAAAPTGEGMTLVPALLLAFVGGLILNLMPCVFPVLSLKVLSFAAPGHYHANVLRRQGIVYALGVVATFVGLAALLLALRAAGEQLGWGFQLQSPGMVTALAVLFFVLALNLSGVFEFGVWAPSSVSNFTARNPYADAALSGVLAVIIASPCTAPFMGAAMGYALAQGAALTVAVFVALGLGMALPFVLLAWFPGWRRALPRPGAWMLRLKQLLAFPLYATVAWLAWVLGAQVDNDAVVRLLFTLILVAFALWAWRAFRAHGARAWRVVAGVAGIASLAVAYPIFGGASERESAAPAAPAADAWQPYSPARVAALNGSGRPVFVDFTAAWCVTCQVNKRLVLNDAGIRSAFAQRGVELVRADWTRRDATISQALASLNRQGVPVYVLYRPGKEPLVLPEILQKQTVLDALATL